MTRLSRKLPTGCTTPLELVKAAVIIHAVIVKIRDGQVTNQPSRLHCHRHHRRRRWQHPGICIVAGGEGSEFCLKLAAEISTRSTVDVCIVVCDGLTALHEPI